MNVASDYRTILVLKIKLITNHKTQIGQYMLDVSKV